MPENSVSTIIIVENLMHAAKSSFVGIKGAFFPSPHRPELDMPVRTMYTYLESGLFTDKNIDLKSKVKFNPFNVMFHISK